MLFKIEFKMELILMTLLGQGSIRRSNNGNQLFISNPDSGKDR